MSAPSQQAPPHLVQRMQEKEQELEQLLILRQLATHLQTHFDELSDKFDGLVQGNQGNHEGPNTTFFLSLKGLSRPSHVSRKVYCLLLYIVYIASFFRSCIKGVRKLVRRFPYHKHDW